MKKLTLLAACALTATMAFGQGKVQFANTPTTLLTTNFAATGASGAISGAGNYIVGLFVGPSANPTYSSLSPVGQVNNAGIAGRFSVNPFTLPAPYDGSSAIAFQVRAWSAGLGATWDAVSGKLVPGYAGTGQATANFQFAPGTYYLGSSAIAVTTPATSIGVPPALFGPTAGSQVSGFALYDVIPTPEPATLALLGLGLTGLLFIRRRK